MCTLRDPHLRRWKAVWDGDERAVSGWKIGRSAVRRQRDGSARAPGLGREELQPAFPPVQSLPDLEDSPVEVYVLRTETEPSAPAQDEQQQ